MQEMQKYHPIHHANTSVWQLGTAAAYICRSKSVFYDCLMYKVTLRTDCIQRTENWIFSLSHLIQDSPIVRKSMMRQLDYF